MIWRSSLSGIFSKAHSAVRNNGVFLLLSPFLLYILHCDLGFGTFRINGFRAFGKCQKISVFRAKVSGAGSIQGGIAAFSDIWKILGGFGITIMIRAGVQDGYGDRDV